MNMGLSSCAKGKFMDNLGGSMNLNAFRFHPTVHEAKISQRSPPANKYDPPLGSVVYFLEECIWAVECEHARVCVRQSELNQPVFEALMNAHGLTLPPSDTLQELPLPLLYSLLHPHTSLFLPSTTRTASDTVSPSPMPPLFAGLDSYTLYTALAARGWRVHRAQRFSFPALAAHDSRAEMRCDGILPSGVDWLRSLSPIAGKAHAAQEAATGDPTDTVAPLPALCSHALEPQPRSACVPRACGLAANCPILALAVQVLEALRPVYYSCSHTPNHLAVTATTASCLAIRTAQPHNESALFSPLSSATPTCPCTRSLAVAAILEALQIDAFMVWNPTSSFAPSRAPLPAALLLVPGVGEPQPLSSTTAMNNATLSSAPSTVNRAELLRALTALVGVRVVWADEGKDVLLAAFDTANVFKNAR